MPNYVISQAKDWIGKSRVESWRQIHKPRMAQVRLEDGAKKRDASARKNGMGQGVEQMAERVRDAIGQGQLGGECAEIARCLKSKVWI